MQMAQRNIPREISRQAAANNRIANEPEEGSLAGRAHVTEDHGEHGLWLQDCKETESDRNNSQSCGRGKYNSAVTPYQHGTGRVNLHGWRTITQILQRQRLAREKKTQRFVEI